MSVTTAKRRAFFSLSLRIKVVHSTAKRLTFTLSLSFLLFHQSSDAVVTDFEHSTGLYRAELEGLAQGKDIFDHYDFTRAPKGTKESPCVVTSEMDYRVVGVTDPDDDSIVIWGRLEEGKGPMLIGDEWFVHKRIGGGGH